MRRCVCPRHKVAAGARRAAAKAYIPRANPEGQGCRGCRCRVRPAGQRTFSGDRPCWPTSPSPPRAIESQPWRGEARSLLGAQREPRYACLRASKSSMCCMSAPPPSGASSGQKSASVASPGKPAIQRWAASASAAARGEGRRRNRHCCSLRKRGASRCLLRREWSGGAAGAPYRRGAFAPLRQNGSLTRDLAEGPA